MKLSRYRPAWKSLQYYLELPDIQNLRLTCKKMKNLLDVVVLLYYVEDEILKLHLQNLLTRLNLVSKFKLLKIQPPEGNERTLRFQDTGFEEFARALYMSDWNTRYANLPLPAAFRGEPLLTGITKDVFLTNVRVIEPKSQSRPLVLQDSNTKWSVFLTPIFAGRVNGQFNLIVLPYSSYWWDSAEKKANNVAYAEQRLLLPMDLVVAKRILLHHGYRILQVNTSIGEIGMDFEHNQYGYLKENIPILNRYERKKIRKFIPEINSMKRKVSVEDLPKFFCSHKKPRTTLHLPEPVPTLRR